MTSILSNGSSALLAFQRALATVSHNVANVATDGYSRQRVDLATRLGGPPGRGYIGGGVQVAGLQRLVDNLVTGRMLESGGELGRLEKLSQLASRIDSMFSGSSTGLSGPWSSFFDAAQGVAAEPASQAARQEMLGRANGLTARFSMLDGELQRMDDEIDATLQGGAEEVNRLSQDIARLNAEISRDPSNVSPDLLDQRDRLVGELSGLVGATTVQQDNGALNVFTSGGQPLVVGATASTMVATADPYRPDRTVLALQAQGRMVSLGDGAIGGSLGGALEARAQVIDPTRAELGRMAAGLAESFNAMHREGMDFYGNLGADFFNVPAPVTRPHANNTGSATLSANVADVGALTGQPIVLQYDGGAWTARNADTGAAIPMTGTGAPGDPLVIEGVEVVVGGAPAANDRFLLSPTEGAASGLDVAISDPNRIAAASPVRASAALSNGGTGSVTGIRVDDVRNPALLNPAQIVFVDAGNYTIDGAGPFPYTPGDTISANGWSLTLDGAPQAGDTFDISANGAGSSDNGNARAFAVLDDARVLGGGANSLNDALSGMTVKIGSTAREAAYGLEGQSAVDASIRAERESLSGVNLDEEAANLLRYQQAYQAAAQVISTADSMFQSLLAAVRR